MLEHKCEVCGKMWRKKLKADGKVVCNKHYKQFKKFGYFKDSSPRTQKDRNYIEVVGDIAYIYLYDKRYNVCAKAIIDSEDVEKVRNWKWRLRNGYCYGHGGSRQTHNFLHRLIMDVDECEIVDHINQNKLDNRKCNLRKCTKSTNQMNVNKYKGVQSVPDKNKWKAHIKKNGKLIYLGTFYIEEEAYYCRWYAERIIFGEFAPQKDEPFISAERKKDIKKLVERKVQRLQ